MIPRIRHFIPSSILRNIYYAFIHSHINYAILNWGSAAPTNLEPVKVSMRKAVRLMAFRDRDAHSEPLFQQFNILNFDDSYRLEVAKFVHDISHNKLQQSFQSMFSLVKKDTIELPGKPLTTNFLFLLFKPIMVKGLSLSLVSKHGITFPRISDLLTQNIHLVQNTLHSYTVSTRKFDLMSSGRQLSVFGSFFVDHELQIAITRRLYTWKRNAEFCSL